MSDSMAKVVHDGGMKRGESLRWLERGVRATVMGMIVAATCYTVSVFGALWGEWRQMKGTPVSQQPYDTSINPTAAILPLAGHWSFAELDWELRSSHLRLADVESRLACFGQPISSEAAASLPDVSQELLELAEILKLRPIDHAGMQTYRVDQPGLKAQFTLCIASGRPKLAALAVAVAHSEEQWQLVEVRRRTRTSGVVSGDFLLPLPSHALRCGARQTNEGRVLLELVSLNTTADELLSNWKNAGWEVRESDFGNGNDFSFLCARGERVVYAWSADPHDSLRSLMLVDAAASANTGH